jgi:hypothetical protein
MFDNANELELFAFTPNDIADHHASRRLDHYTIYFDLGFGGCDHSISFGHVFDSKSEGLG